MKIINSDANFFRFLHPGIRLLLLLILLAAGSWLDGNRLLVALFIVLLAVGGNARLRWQKLLRRTRWLLLSLLLILAFSVPGEALFPSAWSPTWEGLQHAGQQVGHVLLALGFIAAFLAVTPVPALVEGITWLSGAFTSRKNKGQNRDTPSQLAVRVALTLHYAETQTAKNWRQILGTDPGFPAEPPPVLELKISHPQRHDWWLFLLIAGLTLLLVSIT